MKEMKNQTLRLKLKTENEIKEEAKAAAEAVQ